MDHHDVLGAGRALNTQTSLATQPTNRKSRIVFQCSNAKATVVGLGATGLSLARFLHKRGAKVTVVDSGTAPTGLAQLRLVCPDATFHQLDLARDTLPTCDFVALSPGVSRALFALRASIDAGVPMVGDIELFAREMSPNATVVGVTGSNGKTTTTALAGEFARNVRPDACVAGNIGLPILDALEETPNSSSWVLELSSFQLESTQSLSLASATVLNVTDNHLDRYSSFFAYAASKERIFEHARSQVLNRADPWSMSMRRTSVDAITFGVDVPSTAFDFGVRVDGNADFLVCGDEVVLPCTELGVSGAHNAQNALAALALTRPFGVPLAAQQEVLRNFKGMPHRYQLLASVNGVGIIDDSKATTVVATVAALSGSTHPTWLIAGGDGKGQDFAALGAIAAKHCKAVHLIGRDAHLMAASLATHGVAHHIFASLEDATYAALEGAISGDQVLLSPACASWDMFRNYGHRAQVFTDAAAAWAASRGAFFAPLKGVR